MGPTVVVRARSSRALGVVMVVVGVLGTLSTVLGGADAVTSYAGACTLFAVLGWSAFWHPHVEVSDGGVRVVNTLRTVVVPWPALEGIEGRYGLRLLTAFGPVQAWGAQAPSGTGRARDHDSPAAQAVRSRWEALREAGFLDDRRLERPAPVTTWHQAALGAVVAATVAAVALPLLG